MNPTNREKVTAIIDFTKEKITQVDFDLKDGVYTVTFKELVSWLKEVCDR